MTDQEIAQAAAKRWGKTDPAPADVINQHIPRYGQDRTQARRWQRIAQLAFDIATPPGRCEWCGEIMHGKTSGSRRYCDDLCTGDAYRARGGNSDQREARRSA